MKIYGKDLLDNNQYKLIEINNRNIKIYANNISNKKEKVKDAYQAISKIIDKFISDGEICLFSNDPSITLSSSLLIQNNKNKSMLINTNIDSEDIKKIEDSYLKNRINLIQTSNIKRIELFDSPTTGFIHFYNETCKICLLTDNEGKLVENEYKFYKRLLKALMCNERAYVGTIRYNMLTIPKDTFENIEQAKLIYLNNTFYTLEQTGREIIFSDNLLDITKEVVEENNENCNKLERRKK